MAEDKKSKAGREERPRGTKSGKAGGGGGSKRGKGSDAARAEGAAQEEQPTVAVQTPRLQVRYRAAVVSALTKQFQYVNPMQVPRITKIVLNMGLGAAVANPKIVDTAVEELKAMSGQKPVVTRAKKAVANFKLRAGVPIGAMVTLRRTRMWEFLDRLVSVALPRTRDFKGVSRKAFDGHGNYTLGLREQIIFPEINYDKIDAIKGLNVSIVTTARSDDEGRALLQELGVPFRAA
jgi:large subunit ribosomal protein L5